MIPVINKINKNTLWYQEGYRWEIIGECGTDLTNTFFSAIRFWLWHCGIPAKIAFKTWKRN